ncbi:MAG: hypothetical protein OEY34_00270 [Cyclobacteriaceae bacterium]|nr:hypothetical protein [Cyclobacteriaceae bacterium]
MGYLLYSNFPPDTVLFQEGSIPLLQQGNYTYKLHNKFTSIYRFSISALYTTGEKTIPTHIKELKIPSQIYPGVTNITVQPSDTTITLFWDYPYPIEELKGFRIYSESQILVNEETLTTGVRSIRLAFLSKEKMKCKIIPVYKNGKEGLESKTFIISFDQIE